MSRHGGHHNKGNFGLEALGIGSAVGVIAGTYKFGEFLHNAKKLQEVHLENQAFVSVAQRASLDLRETARLLAHPKIKHALSTNPEKRAWIEGAIRDTEKGVAFLVRHTKRVDKDVHGGSWGFGIRNRFRWVLDDRDKAVHARIELVTAHQTLLEVIGFLGSLEPMARHEEKADRRQVDVHVEHDSRREVDIEYDRPREVDVDFNVKKEYEYRDERPRYEYDVHREVRVDRRGGHKDEGYDSHDESDFQFLRHGLGQPTDERRYVDAEGNIVTENVARNVTYRREYEVQEEPRYAPASERVSYRKQYKVHEEPRYTPTGERYTYRRDYEARHDEPERVEYRRPYVEDEPPREHRGKWPPPSRL
ncbi:hypothetical protein EJ05DRAFT_502899 [Pseudovirgaria hyperparasitica]|uniref:Uncharacterized protein n=1 Tax=Pseudovirgaria hyperparasitica TaxID=470096 RepID=A0A6A6VXQ0_9PEZI|nr:uncharacterized protein EJ05DRAFT_502899 [Pseudovirgaria hyperparasitica]KAF2755438.1 hypothetical protein EJ05DRAFT_502899 [Pseudovirgaria hyperparasitica]